MGIYLPSGLQIFGFISSILALFLAWILVQFFAIPIWRMRQYKGPEMRHYFFPFLGWLKRSKDYEVKMGDCIGAYRELAQKNKNIQLEVTNFANRVGLILLGSKVLKDFHSKQHCYQKYYFSKGVVELTGTGLVFAEGATWKNHRKIISSVFNFEFIKGNIPLIVNTTRDFLRETARISLESVDIMSEIQKITGEIVGRIFFGENLNNYKLNNQPLTLYLEDLVARQTMVLKRLPTAFLYFTGLNVEWDPCYRKLMNDVREFRRLCAKIIQDRKASKTNSKDMLGLLLETQNLPNPEDRFSDEDIINEFATFFIAGMDTTGHLITMALYLLHENPKHIERAKKEVQEIYNKQDIPSVESISQMEIMHTILKETLRMYTPAAGTLPRIVTEDHELAGIKVKKGTFVRTNPFYNYANDEYFDEPEKFKPERWDKKENSELDSFVNIPFSAGSRNCIGQHLAIIESKIIMAEFLKMFDFKLTPENYKLVMTFRFLYEPKEKIKMNLHKKFV